MHQDDIANNVGEKDIALGVALPIAYYYLNAWLANYAYHIEISGLLLFMAVIVCMGISILVIFIICNGRPELIQQRFYRLSEKVIVLLGLPKSPDMPDFKKAGIIGKILKAPYQMLNFFVKI